VAQRGPGLVASQLMWVERNGTGRAALTERELLFSPRLSRDGKRLAVDRSDPTTGQGDLWVYDLQRSVSTRLTFHPENESGPAWSPDDRYVYFHRGNQGESAIERVAAGGTGQVETLVSSVAEKRVTHVSHDGTLVLFDVIGAGTLSDIWVYSAAGGEAKPWLATPFAEQGAELSPDGRWIVYQSNESGQSEIYVRDFPDATRKWLISSGGGTMPSWRADGREMFYISSEGKMMAVSIRAAEELEAAAPVELFDAGVRMHPVRQYDVAPDGSRFVINRLDDVPVQPLTLITDWLIRAKR
jgi:eukaryotic-like serine/threonine-protein kinase